jgi:hypothetical protein
LESQAHLAQVVFAGRGVGLGFGPGECREQQSGENANDGDHHQQLDQSESLFKATNLSHTALDSPPGHGSREIRNPDCV